MKIGPPGAGEPSRDAGEETSAEEPPGPRRPAGDRTTAARERGRLAALGPTLAAAVLSVAVVAGLRALPATGAFLDRVERQTRDIRARAFLSDRVPADVAVVAVDEASFTAFRSRPEESWNGLRWPWPPSLHGRLARLLIEEGGAEAVVFDIAFSEPFSAMYLPEYRDLSDLVRHPELTIFACRRDPDRDGPGRAGWVDPVPELRGGGAVGSADLPVDRDGAVRRLVPCPDGRASLALRAAGLLLGGASTLDLEGAELARAYGVPDRPRAIRFYGARRTVPTTSYADLVLPERREALGGTAALRSRFGGKAVFVGATVRDLHDLHQTPLDPQMPGVEIHATAAQNVLDGLELRDRDGREWPLVLAAAAIAALALAGLGPLRGTAVAVLVGGAYAYLTCRDLARREVLWPWVGPLASLSAAAFLAAVLLARRVARERALLADLFGRFVSPAVMRILLGARERGWLAPSEREMTVLFCDLAGFTSYSEGMDPESLFRHLNRLLDPLTGEILGTGGTVDKYLGDGILAFWGAPLAEPDHARCAVRAALAMERRLDALAREPSSSGPGSVHLRIGIATGPVAVGSVGSVLRTDYTVLGDVVNLASRLEGANKFFGTRILANGETVARLGGSFPLRCLGKVAVVGRSRPVMVHEVLSSLDAPAPEEIAAFERARTALEERRLAEALAGFEDLHRRRPLDATVRFFHDRTSRIAENPDSLWRPHVELHGK